jgi:two-component system CitB family sensor kinase
MAKTSHFKWQKLSFRRRLLVIMTLSGLINLTILSVAGFNYLKHWEQQDSGENALGIARFLASSPIIINSLQAKDPALMSQKIESLRTSLDAAFIVVGDTEGIRYSHPISERIGKKMQGGDNDKALLQGLSYVSFAKGSLGQSVRGKTPVFDQQGNIIGVVSVGYLLTNISDKVEHVFVFLIVMALFVVIANAIISNLTAIKFQHAILGFEPEEFGRLYMELEVTLSTIKEGIISIDSDGFIRSINNSACQILNLKSDQVLHKKLKYVLPDSNLSEILLTQDSQSDVDIILNGQAIIANRQLIIVDNKVMGAVSSFRLKNEITELTKQLSQVREYADLLRSQTHEHRNKLNTISGLLHLGKTNEVLGLIGQETQHYQELIEFLRESIADPVIAGVLLGKSERARELGLTLTIDPGSRLQNLPKHIRDEDIVTVLGNFIDNAFDACIASGDGISAKDDNSKNISVSITDYGEEIILEVEDHGIGLPHDISQKQLLELSVSTKKGAHRGVGLHLIDNIIKQYKGQLVMQSETQTGTRMTAYLPKHMDEGVLNEQQ